MHDGQASDDHAVDRERGQGAGSKPPLKELGCEQCRYERRGSAIQGLPADPVTKGSEQIGHLVHAGGHDDRWRSNTCPLRLISRGDELPVFAFTTTERVTGWDVFALSRALRERGWQVPAYTFPADRQDLSVLRIVCRNGFGHDLADLLLADLLAAVEHLNNDSRLDTATGPSGFHH